MSDYIERDKAIDETWKEPRYTDVMNALTEIRDRIRSLPSADVQPVTFCRDCQWLADIKDVDTGEMYHTCGVLGFDVPDGFACNQGKQKGADDGTDKG